MISIGYFYGIIRANLLATVSHFIFDAAVIGLYVAVFTDRTRTNARFGEIGYWVAALTLWPVLMCFTGFQPLLVSLTGLRGFVFFLPVLLLGPRLTHDDLMKLSYGLAFLNITALAFAIAEYTLGVPMFYPPSPVTGIIYGSRDGTEHFFRIPAIFVNAHAFGGTMTLTLPFLFGAIAQRIASKRQNLILMSGLVAALVGVLMCSARVYFVAGAILVIVSSFTGELGARKRFLWIGALIAIAIAVNGNQRLARFKSLSDTDMVTERINGSVNRTFWEILFEYPLGNGLGGGGTSLPYFLQNQVRNPVAIENEYGRILLEQGIIGLILWVGFIVCFAVRSRAFMRTRWRAGRILAWCSCMISFALALIGLGLLTAIPQTLLFLLSLGWVWRQPAPGEAPAQLPDIPRMFSGSASMRVYAE